MDNTIDALNKIIDAIKQDLANSLQENGRFATGQTISELQPVVAENYAALLAPFWIDALENGRLPTPPGTPAGDPTLQQALIPWLSARGIPESASYAIAKKIHEKGYPGKPGVLSVPLADENISRLMEPGVNSLSAEVQQEVAELFDVFD